MGNRCLAGITVSLHLLCSLALNVTPNARPGHYQLGLEAAGCDGVAAALGCGRFYSAPEGERQAGTVWLQPLAAEGFIPHQRGRGTAPHQLGLGAAG